MALIAALALTLTGVKDIDGWIDCAAHRPFVDGCHGWHWAGAFIVWTPLFLALSFALLGLVALVLKRARIEREASDLRRSR